MEFEAWVLAGQEMGETFTDSTTFRYSAPRKPWWISKKRWARWKCDIVEIPRDITVDITQRWLYPKAEILGNVQPHQPYPLRISSSSAIADRYRP